MTIWFRIFINRYNPIKTGKKTDKKNRKSIHLYILALKKKTENQLKQKRDPNYEKSNFFMGLNWIGFWI